MPTIAVNDEQNSFVPSHGAFARYGRCIDLVTRALLTRWHFIDSHGWVPFGSPFSIIHATRCCYRRCTLRPNKNILWEKTPRVTCTQSRAATVVAHRNAGNALQLTKVVARETLHRHPGGVHTWLFLFAFGQDATTRLAGSNVFSLSNSASLRMLVSSMNVTVLRFSSAREGTQLAAHRHRPSLFHPWHDIRNSRGKERTTHVCETPSESKVSSIESSGWKTCWALCCACVSQEN